MRLDLSERQAVDPPKNDAETARTRVSIGDILVTIVGAKTGEVCRIPKKLVDHFVCQSVALLRPLVPLSAKFMELYLASPENGQVQWKQYIYGQGRPHLSFEQLKMTAIALPPLVEQQQAVAEAERRLSVIEELQAAVEANLTRADRLRQSVLRRAFSGDLTTLQ
jgi:type I restriction enzyme S subunit